MPRRYAARRDDNEPEIVRALQQVGASVYRLDECGIPDLLVGWCRKMFLLEVKSPKGTLTKAQRDFRDSWKGPRALIARTPEAALIAIGARAPSVKPPPADPAARLQYEVEVSEAMIRVQQDLQINNAERHQAIGVLRDEVASKKVQIDYLKLKVTK
ncbi:MAG TPA: hypothetical protein VFD36_20500 [Kofleriaceae bacterium]|nr:hypothetical protein [Kofleriaceae bacterium]